MIVAPNAVESKSFSYNPATRAFCAFASDFEPAKFATFFSKAFDDAGDVGFKMISSKTGRAVLFTWSETVRDGDGDIRIWIFEVYNPKREEALEGLTVHILND